MNSLLRTRPKVAAHRAVFGGSNASVRPHEFVYTIETVFGPLEEVKGS